MGLSFQSLNTAVQILYTRCDGKRSSVRQKMSKPEYKILKVIVLQVRKKTEGPCPVCTNEVLNSVWTPEQTTSPKSVLPKAPRFSDCFLKTQARSKLSAVRLSQNSNCSISSTQLSPKDLSLHEDNVGLVGEQVPCLAGVVSTVAWKEMTPFGNST